MEKLKNFLLIFFIPIIAVVTIGGIIYAIYSYLGGNITLIIVIVVLWGIFSYAMADD